MYRALDKEERISYVDMPLQLKNQYQYFTELSMIHLERSGFQARFSSLEANVSDYVNNYLLHNKYLGDEKL